MNKEYREKVISVDWTSRKYRTAWMLTWLMTALFVAPHLISTILFLVGYRMEFDLLPVSYYIPFITGIWFAYFGANVVEKFKRLEKPGPDSFAETKTPVQPNDEKK